MPSPASQDAVVALLPAIAVGTNARSDCKSSRFSDRRGTGNLSKSGKLHRTKMSLAIVEISKDIAAPIIP